MPARAAPFSSMQTTHSCSTLQPAAAPFPSSSLQQLLQTIYVLPCSTRLCRHIVCTVVAKRRKLGQNCSLLVHWSCRCCCHSCPQSGVASEHNQGSTCCKHTPQSVEGCPLTATNLRQVGVSPLQVDTLSHGPWPRLTEIAQDNTVVLGQVSCLAFSTQTMQHHPAQSRCWVTTPTTRRCRQVEAFRV